MIQLSAKCTTGILTYILFTNKGEQIIVKLTDLPPLSCAKQKVKKHIAQDREVKS